MKLKFNLLTQFAIFLTAIQYASIHLTLKCKGMFIITKITKTVIVFAI